MFWTTRGRFWDPFGELRRLQREMNQVFEKAPARGHQDFPALNVWESPDQYVITAEIPGINPDELDVTVLGDTVTIKGSRKADELKEGETYHRRERGSGSFVRTFKLPRAVDANRVGASYQRGLLQLTLPRAEEEKPRSIPLKSS